MLVFYDQADIACLIKSTICPCQLSLDSYQTRSTRVRVHRLFVTPRSVHRMFFLERILILFKIKINHYYVVLVFEKVKSLKVRQRMDK